LVVGWRQQWQPRAPPVRLVVCRSSWIDNHHRRLTPATPPRTRAHTQGLNYDAAAAGRLEEDRGRLTGEVRAAREAVEGLSANMSHLDFSYRCERARVCEEGRR
jgi:hypothetical protein